MPVGGGKDVLAASTRQLYMHHYHFVHLGFKIVSPGCVSFGKKRVDSSTKVIVDVPTLHIALHQCLTLFVLHGDDGVVVVSGRRVAI